MTTAVVVGSGPNGLAAAVTLAAHGVRVTVLEASQTPGGGTRSGELTLPGLLHDECSGLHPLALGNRFNDVVDMGDHGLDWAWPEVQYAHPLDGGGGAAAWQSVEETARHLFDDGGAWRAVFGRLAPRFPDIADDFLQPMLHIPEHPVDLGLFGLFAGPPADWVARLWATPEARALFGGVVAHAFRPLGTLASSAIGMALGTAAHTYGWPVAVGGSMSIARARISALEALGGRVETGVRVRSRADLPPADLVLLDTSPGAAVDILGDLLPSRIVRALRGYRHGPAAFVTHFAVEGGIPWTYEPARRAGTVHVGGTFEQVARAEREVHRGRLPEDPFVLVAQQSTAEPARARDGLHPIDAYAHVPAGFDGDASGLIEAQIERFAAGFRDRIVARTVRSVAQLEADNANYVAGDIITGANDVLQLLFRPRVALDPYSLGAPGHYLCSAATPPGAGAHGMCGYNAALSALAHAGILTGTTAGSPAETHTRG